MLTDRAKALSRIRSWIDYFHTCSDELKDDRSFILDAVKLVGGVLEFARSDFQNDEEIVFEAIKQDNKAIKFANDRFKSDEGFVTRLVEAGCCVLPFITSTLRDNQSVVLAHVQKWGIILNYASERLRGNLDIIKAAMMQYKNAVKYAIFDDLDKETCIQALIEIDPCIELHFGKNDDEEFVIECIRKSTDAFEYASERLKESRDFVNAAVKIDGLVLQFAHEFKNDKFVVLRAGKQNAEAFRYCDATIYNDRDVVLAVVYLVSNLPKRF